MTPEVPGKAEQFSTDNPAPKDSKQHRTYWQRIPLTWRLVLVIMALLAGGLGGTGAASASRHARDLAFTFDRADRFQSEGYRLADKN